MDKKEIELYLKLLGQELLKCGNSGEIVLAGGAVMLLVIKNRDMTKDIDAYFGSSSEAIKIAVKKIANEHNLREDWLNDGVKGFFYGTPPQDLWADYPGLRVYTIDPEYLFAMKAIAARPEDQPDLKALINYLGLKDAKQGLEIIQKYIPENLLTIKTKYLIEDLIP